jgi:arylsulfatase A-like enzyme
MVESMDAAVGRVLAKLDELGIAGRTMVIFTSDNGGHLPSTSNKPLRFGKGSAYEGGLRVPLIIRWPGVIAPGRVSHTPTITMDLYPTLLEMTGVKAPTSASPTGAPGRDGVSLAPLLRGTGGILRTDLFWHYPHHQHYQPGGSMPFGVIRSGDYKLIEFYNDMRAELYNLADDIREKYDLSAVQPKKVAELRERLHAWRNDVGAQMPLPNPAYDPSRPEYTPTDKKKKKR